MLLWLPQPSRPPGGPRILADEVNDVSQAPNEALTPVEAHERLQAEVGEKAISHVHSHLVHRSHLRHGHSENGSQVTLKMYTSHPSKPASPGRRPEYFMNQLKGWSMTSDPETFPQGATWSRNARDWTKEQRDDAIARANEKAKDSQARAPVVDASFERTSSWTRETTVEEDSRLSQESRNFLNETSNTTTDLLESDPLSCDLASDVLPIKISSKHLMQPSSELQTLGPSRLSQQFENQFLGQETDSQSSRNDLQPITTDTSTGTEIPAPERKRV